MSTGKSASAAGSECIFGPYGSKKPLLSVKLELIAIDFHKKTAYHKNLEQDIR
jgi:hypothetical protein